MSERRMKRIAKEILKAMIAEEKLTAHITLLPAVADLVGAEAKENLGRNCKSDDDEEFFSEEDRIVQSAILKLSTIAHNI